MATVTHRVFMTDVSCSLNLRYIAMNTRDVVYTKVPFHVLRWKHKKIGGMCMVYASGKIIHHGEKMQLRKYVRLLQKMDFPIRLQKISLVTQSATFMLPNVNYELLVNECGAQYEPEVFHACILKKNEMTFTIYNSGKVVITGIKNLDEANGTLIEIALTQERTLK